MAHSFVATLFLFVTVSLHIEQGTSQGKILHNIMMDILKVFGVSSAETASYSYISTSVMNQKYKKQSG